ncbi:MAG: hypothetical protein LQ337_004179 [Flavoplaca oasis]|nr:MAG: hypothetical protein LQ337_004179 [Flavoplaca oasis]
MSLSLLKRQFARASSRPLQSTLISTGTNPTLDEATVASSTFTARHASSSATGGDMANPQSSSSEQQQVKSSRATDSNTSPDTASVQQPVSDRSSIPGDQDEGTPSHDNVKQDPNKPAEEKKRNVESQGNKPLGPEDHQ